MKIHSLIAFGAAAAGSLLHAQTTYTYTGHAFNYVGTYGSDVSHLSGFFTVDQALAAGTTDFLSAGDFIDYSFTDGRYTSDLSNRVATDSWYPGGTSVMEPIFAITTDATGKIVNWDINVLSPGALLSTVDNTQVGIAGYIDTGVYDNTDADPTAFPYESYDAYTNNGVPGVWTESSVAAAPEAAATAPMLLLGVAVLSAVSYRTKKQIRPAC